MSHRDEEQGSYRMPSGAPAEIIPYLYLLRLPYSLQFSVRLCISTLLLLQHEGSPRSFAKMKLSVFAVGSAIATANAAVLGDRSQFDERAAYAVVGKPEGFASGTTGGGSAACAIPSSVAQLKSWLTDSTARCIVLDKERVFKNFHSSMD